MSFLDLVVRQTGFRDYMDFRGNAVVIGPFLAALVSDSFYTGESFRGGENDVTLIQAGACSARAHNQF